MSSLGHRCRVLGTATLLFSATAAAGSGEFSGLVSGQWLQFYRDPAITAARPSPALQHDSYGSLALQPEYSWESEDRSDSITFTGFARWDRQDSKRTHADIRELKWTRVAGDWENVVGIGKEYWGVTEGEHLVDIINQTDLVENQDGEDKLGQPMFKLAWFHDYGTLSFYLLPGFRPRTYPGPEGRLFPFVIDQGDNVYASAARRRHVDLAARAYSYFGPFELAVSHFIGTTREPVLEFKGYNDQGAPVLRAVYNIINQTGLELTAVAGNWLWKFEGITRGGQGDRFSAATGGFEYTFVGAFGSSMDLGVIAEYMYDDRDSNALVPVSQPRTTLQNDVLIGGRFTFNDIQSTQILAGLIVDMDGGGRTYNIEASRRLGDSWLLSLEARGVVGTRPGNDPLLDLLRDDDSVRLELAYYF